MRNFIGLIGLVLFVPIYIFFVVWLVAPLVEDANTFVQTLFYLVAGIVWTWPAIIIIRWTRKPR